MAIGLSEAVVLGAVAGFTVYLGLPVAAVNVSARGQSLLTGFAVGVLVFLLVEIFFGVIEPIEAGVEQAAEGAGGLPLGLFVAAFVGLFVGLVGLVWLRSRRGAAGPAVDGSRIALVIAGGIGLHNFSEGLAIGQAAATGAASLALLLVVGFALHNVTEGFAIATPLVGEHPRYQQLVVLGLVAGGPTFLGTLIGLVVVSPVTSVLFLALAAGAILFIVPQLLRTAGGHASELGLATAVVVGFFAGLATELLLDLTMAS